MQKEAEMLTGLVKHVLPKAGKGVRRLDLKNSKTLTNGMVGNIAVDWVRKKKKLINIIFVLSIKSYVDI